MTFIKLYIKLISGHKFCVHVEIYRNDACGGEDSWVHFPTNNYIRAPNEKIEGAPISNLFY